eukprot:RCo043874
MTSTSPAGEEPDSGPSGSGGKIKAHLKRLRHLITFFEQTQAGQGISDRLNCDDMALEGEGDETLAPPMAALMKPVSPRPGNTLASPSGRAHNHSTGEARTTGGHSRLPGVAVSPKGVEPEDDPMTPPAADAVVKTPGRSRPLAPLATPVATAWAGGAKSPARGPEPAKSGAVPPLHSTDSGGSLNGSRRAAGSGTTSSSTATASASSGAAAGEHHDQLLLSAMRPASTTTMVRPRSAGRTS